MNISFLRFDRNIFLIAAVGLVGNGHAKLPAFQQGLQMGLHKAADAFISAVCGDLGSGTRLLAAGQNLRVENHLFLR